MLSIILGELVLYGLPVAIVIFFIVSLVRFMAAKSKNRKAEGTFSAEEMKKRKVTLIVASILAAALLLFIIGLIALMFLAVAYM